MAEAPDDFGIIEQISAACHPDEIFRIFMANRIVRTSDRLHYADLALVHMQNRGMDPLVPTYSPSDIPQYYSPEYRLAECMVSITRTNLYHRNIEAFKKNRGEAIWESVPEPDALETKLKQPA